MNKYTAFLTYSDGWWTATCAEVPAAITQGKTIEEAKENLTDAVALVLETQREMANRVGVIGEPLVR
jgi:predicted RNase H-like HicB family nuclease